MIVKPSFSIITRLRRVIVPCKGKVQRVTRRLLSYSEDTLLSSNELKILRMSGLKISFIFGVLSLLSQWTVYADCIMQI